MLVHVCLIGSYVLFRFASGSLSPPNCPCLLTPPTVVAPPTPTTVSLVTSLTFPFSNFSEPTAKKQQKSLKIEQHVLHGHRYRSVAILYILQSYINIYKCYALHAYQQLACFHPDAHQERETHTHHSINNSPQTHSTEYFDLTFLANAFGGNFLTRSVRRLSTFLL